jgi:hypothetical protein
MKLDLLTNATIVGDAMKFVSEYSNNNNKKLDSKENCQESREESDYNEDSELEGEQKQEEEQVEQITIELYLVDYNSALHALFVE